MDIGRIIQAAVMQSAVAEHWGSFSKPFLPAQGINRWSWRLSFIESPNETIGAIEVWRPGTPENRGFWLARKYWGWGLMSEALKPVTDFAFDDLGFEKLILSNALETCCPGGLKEKAGARLVGTRPRRRSGYRFLIIVGKQLSAAWGNRGSSRFQAHWPCRPRQVYAFAIGRSETRAVFVRSAARFAISARSRAGCYQRRDRARRRAPLIPVFLLALAMKDRSVV